jgi:anti-sigma regulatory factor (Ser/Thr protein kinase)
MATVELSFSALPAHVRTARLVAAAVARRSGMDEAVLDEVRLAVGEACSRAVELHRVHCPDEPVQVSLSDDDGAFRVAVADRAPAEGAGDDDALRAFAESTNEAEPLPSGVGIAVISGLVDDLEVVDGDQGAVVRMTWPAIG